MRSMRSRYITHTTLQVAKNLTKNHLKYSSRTFSTTPCPLHPVQVAIVGSGPSAFYTALHLQKRATKPIQIDIFERLPVPFGLSRYGVAPDHPEVKNCEEKFTEIMEKKGDCQVSFYGNVNIGEDIPLQTLKSNYNIIVFAYGCSKERTLKIPGADLPAVISSRQFVGWYNGHPDEQSLNPPLDKVEDVVIIGNGNVALDVARVLLASPETWKNTDLCSNALEALKKSTVKKVRIVARRGFLQSAFTNKELRELLELEKEKVFLEEIDPVALEPAQLMKDNLSRVNKRKLALIEKYLQKPHTSSPQKTWCLDFLKSPVEFFKGKNGVLSSTKFQVNELEEEINKPAKVKPTDEFVSMKSELVITSIGYQGVPLKTMESIGIEFDTARGTIPNKRSRVLNSAGEVINGVYATGWISNGPVGVIASTMMNSFATGEEILSDLEGLEFSEKRGFESVKSDLKYTTWDHWKKIDQKELQGGVREKIVDVNKMMEVV